MKLKNIDKMNAAQITRKIEELEMRFNNDYRKKERLEQKITLSPWKIKSDDQYAAICCEIMKLEERLAEYSKQGAALLKQHKILTGTLSK